MSGDDPGPASAAEAAAIAGAAVNFRGSYGGLRGQAARDYEKLQERRRQEEQIQAQENMNRASYTRASSNAPAQAQSPYEPFQHRADVYIPDDPRQLALIAQGYTASQAAEKLRYEAQQRRDYKEERRYETLRMQAWTTETGKSAEYHFQAKQSGLPQAPNPYEYGADLLTYVEKGYPQKRSEAFSPVDPRVLNLPGGAGGQAHIWKKDGERNYDLRPALDVVARAQREGQMGAYGALGGMPLAEQQAIGRKVNANPNHQAMGFRTNEDAMAKFTPEVRNMDRGTFVQSYTPATAPGAPGKSKYLSSEEMFKGGTVQTTYRPSDQTLFLLGMPDVGGRGQAIKKGLIGLSEFAFPGSNIKTTTGKTQEVERARLNPSGGAMATWKYIDPKTNKPTDTMKFAEGAPYEKDGVMYQDYKVSDLSKVTITPVKTEVSEAESGFARGERRFSEQVASKVFPASNPIKTNTALDYPIQYATQAYEGVRQKPLSAGINVGVGLGLTALTAGVINPAVTGLGRPALTFAATKVLPAALAGAYGAEFTYSATKGFTDFSPEAAGRAGYRSGYETLPLIAGGMMYRPLANFATNPPTYRGVREGVADTIFELRQNAGGISRVPHGSINYDYTFTGRASPPPPSGTARSSPQSVMYDRLMPPRQTYGGGFSGETQFTPKPKNWESMSKGQQLNWMQTNFREWIDVGGGKRVYTYAGYSKGRQPIFANDEGMASFGGNRRYKPQPQESPAPQQARRTVYAEPMNINIKTEAELGRNLPAVYEGAKPAPSPYAQTKNQPVPGFRSALKHPASYLELERLGYGQRDKLMLGGKLQPNTLTVQETALATRTRSRTQTEPARIFSPAILPEPLARPAPKDRTTVVPSIWTTTTPVTTTRRKPEPFPVPFPTRSPFTQPQPGRTVTPGILPKIPTIIPPTTPPLIPPMWGGGGQSYSHRLRGGRRHTEYFSTNFGQLTANLFGSSSAMRISTARRAPAKRRK